MSLTPGTRLGAYEIAGSLGAGGMGEVYRARDTRLGRDVAIKVLPEALASDPERTGRFQREAQLLAALNHPHIATIHGFEEVAATDREQPPLRFLVMELVEGDTLAQRLGSGPIPVTEALAIARQIAGALQAAHEKGIIHRDLKPANIVVSADGEVKVLDFGLAKALDATSGVAPGPQDPAYMATHSPTLSIAATQAGVILGTAAYMAPEQARGKVADKRADIWAFGCVLYEMLTGRRAFEGEDAAQTLAFVMARDPDWTALRADVPSSVSMLLRGCLEKEPRKRIADISTATFAIDQVTRLDAIVGRVLSGRREGGLQNDTPESRVQKDPAYARSAWRRVAPIAAALLIGGLLAAGGVWLLTRPAPPSVVRTSITTSGVAAIVLQGSERDVAITLDGSRVVYRGNNQLLVRALDRIEPTALSGTFVPRGPFISPDGQWVGFFDGATFLKKVAITGGPAVTITRVDGTGPRGATWGPDGTIIFATFAPATGLHRVSAAGGEPTVLTKPDRQRGEGDHYWPEFLPGGEAVLFTIAPAAGGIENAQVAVLDLRTGVSKVLIRGGSHARYVPTGHLVYAVAGTLRAVAFDLERLEVTGTPAPVLEGVVTTPDGGADVALAANGTLVYVPAGTAGAGGQQRVVSVDRQGRATPLPSLPPDTYRDVRVSPDGTRIALATQTDVWTYDLARATLSRLTTHPAADTRPIWTPDGQRIVFTSNREGYPEMFWRQADGTGNDDRLLARAKDLIDLRGTSWSADGRQLLFVEVSAAIQCAIGQIPIDRPSDPTVLVKSDFCNDWPTVSPDGRWVAYHSNLSGRQEIYVERYPDLGNRQQISTEGGGIPIWSHDGRELFFRSVDARQILAVPVRSGTTLVAGRPQMLFETTIVQNLGGSRPYDIMPDGRFIIITNAQGEGAGAPAPSLTLVLNWTEELKRLVPR